MQDLVLHYLRFNMFFFFLALSMVECADTHVQVSTHAALILLQLDQ